MLYTEQVLSLRSITAEMRPDDDPPEEIAASLHIYFVGARYSHHAEHSGYEGFSRYIGRQLHPPIRFRYLHFEKYPELGWDIDVLVARVLKRKFFAVGLLLTELSAAMHMFWHRRAVYHVLYADTDVCLLGRVGRLTENFVVASFHEPPDILATLVDRKLAESLDAVVLVSEFQRPFFENLMAPERIFVAALGADTSFFHPAERRSLEPTFITVGGHLRDFETLATTIDLVLSKRPDVRFIAVSTNGEQGKPSFRDPRVEHLERISDEQLRARYQSSWAGIFCFEQTTANVSVLEAMACGVPAIVTDTGGIREYVGDNGAAVLCPLRDPEAMSAAVLKMVNQDSESALAMRSAARQQAIGFDFRRAAEILAGIYERVPLLGRV
jgi:glycosyltransferase involved in cell wall biosynthesis